MDPVSVLGLLSFCVGLAGALPTTLDALNFLRTEVSATRTRLIYYRQELITCRCLMLSWCRKWCKETSSGYTAHSDVVYRYVWTSEGYDEISERLNFITKTSQELKTILSRMKPESSHWTFETFCRGLRHQLTQKTIWNEGIKRLRTAIEDLKYRSDFLRQHRNLSMDRQIRQPTLQDIALGKAFSENLQRFCTDLHAASSSSIESDTDGDEWWLELRLPNEHGTVGHPDSQHSVDIDFTIKSLTETSQLPDGQRVGAGLSRVRVFFQSEAHSEAYLHKLVQTIQAGGPKSPLHTNQDLAYGFCWLDNAVGQSQSLRERLDVITTRVPEISRQNSIQTHLTDNLKEQNENRITQFLVGMDRATIALGLVNWFAVSWGTPWFSRLCCCGIRWTKIRNGEARHTFRAQIHDSENVTCYANDRDCGTLLKLGTVLAELALVKPLTVVSLNGETIWYDSAKRPISYCELLQRTRENVSMLYMEVVRKCFHLDIKSRGRAPHVDDLIVFDQLLIRPLIRHYALTKKQLLKRIHRRSNRYLKPFEEKLSEAKLQDLYVLRGLEID